MGSQICALSAKISGLRHEWEKGERTAECRFALCSTHYVFVFDDDANGVAVEAQQWQCHLPLACDHHLSSVGEFMDQYRCSV